MADRLLTVAEAAKALNVGERFVRRLVAERRIDVVHVGRHVRISESAVLAFIAAGTVPALSPSSKRTVKLRLVA